MTPPARNRSGLVALLAAALVLCGFTPAEGRRRALYDLAAHHPHWYLIGYPSGGHVEFGRILREQYGVILQLAGCESDQPGVEAYNAVIEQALERRYGRGVLTRAWAQAQEILRRDGPSAPDVRRDGPSRPGGVITDL